MNRDEIENFEGYQSASEKGTALFFHDIGLKCIDLCFKIKADDGSDITDIDGIFLDEENKVIIIYDDSTQSGQHNTKILSFLSKCQQDSCEKQIYDSHSELPLYPIYILYIDKSRDSGSSLEAIQHIFNRTSKVIFAYSDDMHPGIPAICTQF